MSKKMLLLFTFIIWLPQILSWENRHGTIICEFFNRTIECDGTWKIHIAQKSVLWGRKESNLCTDYPNHFDKCISSSSNANAAAILVKRCDLKKKCTIFADTKTFGDPCPKIYKYLQFHYSCQMNYPPPSHQIQPSTVVNLYPSLRTLKSKGKSGSHGYEDDCRSTVTKHKGTRTARSLGNLSHPLGSTC